MSNHIKNYINVWYINSTNLVKNCNKPKCEISCKPSGAAESICTEFLSDRLEFKRTGMEWWQSCSIDSIQFSSSLDTEYDSFEWISIDYGFICRSGLSSHLHLNPDFEYNYQTINCFQTFDTIGVLFWCFHQKVSNFCLISSQNLVKS